MHEESGYGAELNREERSTAMFCHLAGLCFFLGIPFAGLIAPLVIWLLKREDSAFVDAHGKEVVNFQISIVIYTFISIPLIFVFGLGILLLIAVSLAVLACSIMAAIKAKDGERFQYPMTIRLL